MHLHMCLYNHTLLNLNQGLRGRSGGGGGSKTSVIAGAVVGALLGIVIMAAVMGGCWAIRGRRRNHQQYVYLIGF